MIGRYKLLQQIGEGAMGTGCDGSAMYTVQRKVAVRSAFDPGGFVTENSAEVVRGFV